MSNDEEAFDTTRGDNNELLVVIESEDRLAAEEENNAKRREESADAKKIGSNTDSFITDIGKKFTMAFIKNQVKDEPASSLERFPAIKEIMDRMDYVEVIQLGWESRCDDMEKMEDHDT